MYQKDYNWMVCVSCMTYNQAPYITDAMNGFCMQETTFPFVCTIVDDASTDGEQEVIKNYLQQHFNLEDKSVVRNEETDDYVLTFARHRINHNCYFAVLYLKYNHHQIKKKKIPYLLEWREKSKYIALCEGDDYWINEKKLLIQVDFLEEHKDVSMCFHSAKIENYMSKKDESMHYSVEYREYKSGELISNWIVPTASIIARSNCSNVKTNGNHRIVFGDIVFILKCAACGKVYGFTQIMSVYRILPTGTSHNRSLYKKNLERWPAFLDFMEENFTSLPHNVITKQRALTYLRLALKVHIIFSKQWFEDIYIVMKNHPFAFIDLIKEYVKKNIVVR